MIVGWVVGWIVIVMFNQNTVRVVGNLVLECPFKLIKGFHSKHYFCQNQSPHNSQPDLMLM